MVVGLVEVVDLHTQLRYGGKCQVFLRHRFDAREKQQHEDANAHRQRHQTFFSEAHPHRHKLFANLKSKFYNLKFGHTSMSMRVGFSITSLRRFRKLTASRPSTMR